MHHVRKLLSASGMLASQVPAALDALKERKDGYLAKRAEVKEKGYPAEEEEQPHANGAGPSQPVPAMAPAQPGPGSLQEPTPAESMGAAHAANHSGGDVAPATSSGPWKTADAGSAEEPADAAPAEQTAELGAADEPTDAAEEPADAVATEEPAIPEQPEDATPAIADTDQADGEADGEVEDALPTHEEPAAEIPAQTESAEQPSDDAAAEPETSNAALTAAALAQPIETADDGLADEEATVPPQAETGPDGGAVAVELQHGEGGRITVQLRV